MVKITLVHFYCSQSGNFYLVFLSVYLKSQRVTPVGGMYSMVWKMLQRLDHGLSGMGSHSSKQCPTLTRQRFIAKFHTGESCLPLPSNKIRFNGSSRLICIKISHKDFCGILMHVILKVLDKLATLAINKRSTGRQIDDPSKATG